LKGIIMQVSEIKKLKVGDKVKIKKGSKSYDCYIPEMDLAVGAICTVSNTYDSIENGVVLDLPHRIGTYSSMYFSPSWIECKVEDSKELPKVADNVVSFTREHPQAEVLRWIADGEEVEYWDTISNEWCKFNTSNSFCIFEAVKYRKVEKKFQILCKDNFTSKYFIAKGLFSKEEASNRDDFVQVLE